MADINFHSFINIEDTNDTVLVPSVALWILCLLEVAKFKVCKFEKLICVIKKDVSYDCLCWKVWYLLVSKLGNLALTLLFFIGFSLLFLITQLSINNSNIMIAPKNVTKFAPGQHHS